jgi:LPS-assembly protein
MAQAAPVLGQAPLTLRETGEDVTVLADRIEQIKEDLLIAVGNVEITRGERRLTAERVEINRRTGDATAQGKVTFFDGQDRLLGERIDYNLKTDTGVVYNGSAFSPPYYRLSGERMEKLGERLYSLRQGVFTTCEGDPPDWSFRAGAATADIDEHIFGRDGSFWIRDLPLIPWVPFFAAPIRRERQTGFLLPTLGFSSKKGFFAKIPYYWAIDDSQDLTLSLDPYSRRGVGAAAEYRYILSESARGGISGSFIREALKDNDDRGTFSLKHSWQIDERLSLKADVSVTSDDLYFRDYGDSLKERSLQRAESNLFVTRRWDSWNLVGNVKWYQDLTSRRPLELQRVPEIRLSGVRQPLPGLPSLLYEVESSFTNFVRDVGSDGVRADLHPRVFLPLSVGGLFTLTPFVGGRGTLYNTRVIGSRLTRADGVEIEQTKDEARLRAQGEAGVDLESRASRVYSLDGAGGIDRLQHLIEPRVNVTEIRGVNQKALPQYDREIDRIGKVSQVTYSITNRLNAKTVAGQNQEAVRWELARFLVGQTVNLLPDADEPFKDLSADLIVQPNRYFRFRGDASYNVHGEGLQIANTDLSATVKDVTATVGTRFNERSDIEFVKGELQAKLLPSLDAHAATNWDVRKGAMVEGRFGLDFIFQCWAIALEYIGRHKGDDEVRFSVNLLGLGKVGSRAGTGTR